MISAAPFDRRRAGSDCTYSVGGHGALCDSINALRRAAERTDSRTHTRANPSRVRTPPVVIPGHQHRTPAAAPPAGSSGWGKDPHLDMFVRTAARRGLRVEEMETKRLAWHGLRNVSASEGHPGGPRTGGAGRRGRRRAVVSLGRGAPRRSPFAEEGRERHLRESIFSTRCFASVFASVFMSVCVCLRLYLLSMASSSRPLGSTRVVVVGPPPRKINARVPLEIEHLHSRASPRALLPRARLPRRGSRTSPPREADRRPRPSPSPSPSRRGSERVANVLGDARGSSAFVVITHPIGRNPQPLPRASPSPRLLSSPPAPLRLGARATRRVARVPVPRL